MGSQQSGALLIYDSECEYTKKLLSKIVPQSEYIQPVPWENKNVQSFLIEQFGWTPFTMLVIDETHVYLGEDAVNRLLRDQEGYKQYCNSGFQFLFRTITTRVGTLIEDQKPEYVHGTYLLDPEAKTNVDHLRPATNISVE